MKNNCNFATDKNMMNAAPLMKTLFDIIESGFASSEELSKDSPSKFPPLMNIIKNDENMFLEFLIPGAKKEDIKITFDDKMLTVSYSRPDASQSKFVKKEFGHDNYERKMRLQPNMDLENMVAEYNGGVLTLTIPVKQKEEAKVTEVSVV